MLSPEEIACLLINGYRQPVIYPMVVLHSAVPGRTRKFRKPQNDAAALCNSPATQGHGPSDNNQKEAFFRN